MKLFYQSLASFWPKNFSSPNSRSHIVVVKTFFIAVFLVAVTLLVLKPYLSSGIPQTHDGENHVARFAQYKWAVKEGQLPPRFAPYLLNGYGYPVFNYNYPLANIISLPFSALKISYLVTFKIQLLMALLLGSWGAWFLGQSVSNQMSWTQLSEKYVWSWQLLLPLLWLSSPYLLNTMLVRGNIGEAWAMAFLPWVLLAFDRLLSVSNISRKEWLGWIAILSLFSLSHNLVVVFFMPIGLLYVLARYSFRQTLASSSRLVLTGLAIAGLGAWFWLPAIWEKSLVVVDGAKLIAQTPLHAITLSQALLSPVQFGFSFPGRVDSLNLSWGLAQILIVLLAVLYIIYGLRSSKRVSIFHQELRSNLALRSLTGLIGLWFFVSALQFLSTPLFYDWIPGLAYIQFPWRWQVFNTVLVIPVAALVLPQLSTKVRALVLALALWQIFTWASYTPPGIILQPNAFYDRFSQSTSTLNENLPKSFTFTNWSERVAQPEILPLDLAPEQATSAASTASAVIIKKWSGTNHEFQFTAETPVLVIEPTMYFPGWQTRSQLLNSAYSQAFPLELINNDKIGGRIAYTLPAGTHRVSTHFYQETWPRLLGNSISLIMACIWIGFTLHPALLSSKIRIGRWSASQK